MAIKLVCLDVDGTLIDSNGSIPEKNLTSIRRAINEKGVHFAIVSGRISQSAKELQERLGVTGGPVSSFGGCILEDENQNIIEEYTIDKLTALTVSRLSKKYNMTVITYLRHHWYEDGRGDTKWYKSEFEATDVKGIHLENIDNLIRQHEPNKFLVINDNEEIIRQFEAELNSICSGKLKTYLSWPKFLEVMPVDADKGTAAKGLMKYWGLKKEEVMAVGDYNNDLHMFKEAGVSVAVANAVQEVKDCATYVSPLSNEQGAVAEAVQRFILDAED